MVYLLFGDDDFLIQEELARIRASLGPEDMVSLNTTRLMGEGLTLQELQAVCDAVPFLAPARLVIVEGLLARFERLRTVRQGLEGIASTDSLAREAGVGDSSNMVRTGPRTSRKTDTAEPGTAWGQFASYCRQMPETTHLVFIDGPVSQNNPLLTRLGPVAEVHECRRLRRGALEQWVRERATQLQSSITPAALQLLVQVVGDGLWILNSELQKLSLYADGGPIQPQHVHELVASARETTIFSLIDAVAEGRLRGAHHALHALLQDGLAAPYILFMLARQFRLLLLARALTAQDVTGSSLKSRLGIASEYPFRKTLEQSRRYTAPMLEGALRRILDADVAIKTGKLEPEMALELLVTHLCGVAR